MEVTLVNFIIILVEFMIRIVTVEFSRRQVFYLSLTNNINNESGMFEKHDHR